MKTAPTNKKIREIIESVREERIVPRPEFQRRLVWLIADKNHFLDSIIRGYPFPEIYLADGDVDLDTGKGTQLLVDGLQRVSTIVQYFEGSPELKLTSVPAYKDLTTNEKTAFLQYDVAVRDLGSISKDEVVEVFRRINATKYSLTDIEVSNAVYRGELKGFAERLSAHSFFAENRVFGTLDMRRMGDLRFALLITITAITSYFNRDDKFQDFLEMYNDEFPARDVLYADFEKVFEFIDECGFSPKSRVWRKSDLFTLIVELLFCFSDNYSPNPLDVVNNLQTFFDEVDSSSIKQSEMVGIYYKSAVQANNDRVNRVRRGHIIGGLLRLLDEETILTEMRRDNLI